MNNQLLVSALQQVLADSYNLALKTQNYHWNITGPNFKSLHLLFEEQYDSLSDAIDMIAERIRSLGYKTPASLELFARNTTLKNADENATTEEMLDHLSCDQLLVKKSLLLALVQAKKNDDEVTSGMIADLLSMHEKNVWMLKSSMA